MALTLGSLTSGNLATQGQIDNYTFTATPGQQFYYDGLSADPSGPSIFI